jgi:3D (Asp-Asp-Asp) domain-containing protein
LSRAVLVGLLLLASWAPASLSAQEDGDDGTDAPLWGDPLLEEEAPQSWTPPPVLPVPSVLRQIRAVVTAYCLQGTTRSGTAVRSGVVATDPAVIPLGSRLTIDGLPGLYSAEDTGSGVKGNHVDVWFSSCAAALGWGRQTRMVTILS